MHPLIRRLGTERSRIQKHQFKRVSWGGRPRRRDIINLTPVAVGGVGRASA